MLYLLLWCLRTSASLASKGGFFGAKVSRVKLNTKRLGSAFSKTDYKYNNLFYNYYIYCVNNIPWLLWIINSFLVSCCVCGVWRVEGCVHVLCMWVMSCMHLEVEYDSFVLFPAFYFIIRWRIFHLVGKVVSFKISLGRLTYIDDVQFNFSCTNINNYVVSRIYLSSSWFIPISDNWLVIHHNF